MWTALHQSAEQLISLLFFKLVWLKRLKSRCPQSLLKNKIPKKKRKFARLNKSFGQFFAGVAQLVERPTCNRMVEGSSPFASRSAKEIKTKRFETSFPFWGCRIAAIAGDCKSPVFGLRWFESSHPQSLIIKGL